MSDAPHHEPVKVLTEQTSKAIKLRILLCNVAAGIGFLGLMVTKEMVVVIPCAALFLASCAYYCWVKFQKWWHHG